MNIIDRKDQQEFFDKYCLGNTQLIACAESAFYYVNKLLAERTSSAGSAVVMSDEQIAEKSLAAPTELQPVAHIHQWQRRNSDKWSDCTPEEYKYRERDGYVVRTLYAAAQATHPDTARLNAFIDWYFREGMRAEFDEYGHVRQTTREMIIAGLDRMAAAMSTTGDAAIGEKVK